jgi:hypothetical protein
MAEQMSWITLPIIRVGGLPVGAGVQGRDLPRLTAASLAALAGAAPLPLRELACVLAGVHPCAPEMGDDVSLLEAAHRIYRRLKEDVARGMLPRRPTVLEGIEWAQRIRLPITEELAAYGAGAGKPSSAASRAHDTLDGEDRRGKAHLDADLQTEAKAIAAEFKAAGKLTPKKVIAHELKLRHPGPLPDNEKSIIRRIRKTW